MGGNGSGNWCRAVTKPTQSSFWRFSVSDLRKRGGIIARQESDSQPWIRVQYVQKTTGKNHDYKICLAKTRPRYGGWRWWFICPRQGCCRRVGVLYLAEVFACRHCHKLAYNSQNESPPFRLLSKAQKIHRMLGGDGRMPGENIPPKPKRMHRKTYQRHVDKMQAAYNTAFFRMGQNMGLFDDENRGFKGL